MATTSYRWISTGLTWQRILGHRRQQLRMFFSRGSSNRSSEASDTTQIDKVDVDALLGKPCWSVSSLLSIKTESADLPKITSKQLQHLLRLSALPPPSSLEEEQKMLSTLQSQLHFVREIQKVDTTGVKPLTSLRDETTNGEKEAELGLEDLAEAIEAEEIRGKFHPRIRRKKGIVTSLGNQLVDQWDVMGCAEKKVGRYFVVEGGNQRS